MLKNNRKLIISDCLSASLSAHFSLSLHLSLQLWLGNRQLRRELLFHHQPRLRIVSITCFIKRYSKSTSPPLLLFPHFSSTGLRCAANFLLVTTRRRHRRVCWPRELRNMQTSIREKVCEMHLNATWHSKRRSYRIRTCTHTHTLTHTYIELSVRGRTYASLTWAANKASWQATATTNTWHSQWICEAHSHTHSYAHSCTHSLQLITAAGAVGLNNASGQCCVYAIWLRLSMMAVSVRCLRLAFMPSCIQG